MITFKELNPNNYQLQPEVFNNAIDFLCRINIIRYLYGRPLSIHSLDAGIRSISDQEEIYKRRGQKPKSSSKHIIGQAIDLVSNPRSDFWHWCMHEGMKHLERLNLYLEDFEATKTYVHIQCGPPGSGRRIFKP